MEKIIEEKHCKQCQVECPDCRSQRRLCFRNERSIYKRQCDAEGGNIISIYHPNSKQKVYDSAFWWSDKWSALDYGRDVDMSLPFLDQLSLLIQEVPRIAMMSVDVENSDYTNQSYDNKNCYMCFAIANCEDMYYSECATHNTDCIDI